MIARLSNLRAQSFVPDQAKAGLSSPGARRQRAVRRGQAGTRALRPRRRQRLRRARRRAGGAAQLDANAFEEAVKALDEIK
jgi:hypothetical protein